MSISFLNIIFAFTLLITISCSNRSDETVNHAFAINQTYDDWVAATNEKDIDRWSSFIAPDAVFLPPDSKSLESVAEIKKYYIGLFQDPNFRLECDQLFVQVSESEDFAWSRGVCNATYSTPEGTVKEGSSKWTKVWVRMSDGKWKCKLNAWNSNEI